MSVQENLHWDTWPDHYYKAKPQIGYTNTLASLASDRREQKEYLEELYKFERTP